MQLAPLRAAGTYDSRRLVAASLSSVRSDIIAEVFAKDIPGPVTKLRALLRQATELTLTTKSRCE